MKRHASSDPRAGKHVHLIAARCSLLALLIAVAAFLPIPAFALDVPPPPTEWYTDTAGLLDSAQATALNEKLRAFEQQSGAQFIIYVFPSLQGEALEDFTMRCAEKWKVGNKKYDNGLILFVFKTDRKLRVEVGYGLEGTITDAFSSDVIRNYIAPHFRDNDFAGGLNAGADAVIAKIKGGEAPVPPTSPGATGQQSAPRKGGTGLPCSPFLFLVVIIFALVILPRILMPNGRHGCGGCLLPFFLWPGGGSTFGGGGGGFSGGGFGGGGFSGGGGGFGGGGASGGW